MDSVPQANGLLVEESVANGSEMVDAPTAEQTEWHGKTILDIPWSVYQGQAEDILQRLPAESVNCVVTSPPYYWLRNYGVDGQIGMEETVEGYVKAISAVMDEIKRVLCKNGVIFLNIGDTYYSGKGKSHGTDKKSNKRRFGLRAVDIEWRARHWHSEKINTWNPLARCY